MRSGFISIIGRPNVGKSTLLNAMIGEKIAIATAKPQTTRNAIRGIYTRQPGTDGEDDPGAQLIFVDTPGLHRERNRLGTAMNDAAKTALGDADVVLFLVDAPQEKQKADRTIFEMVRAVDAPKILVINKIDTMEPDEYLRIFNEYDAAGVFDDIYGTSALTGKNVVDLRKRIESLLEDGPMFFPDDMITDSTERFYAEEVIREKALLYLNDEVPHGIAVETESFEETEGLIRIHAVIYCEKKSQKGIIIGKNGRKLKGIGKAAREELESFFGTKVYLELWVKVRENWRDSRRSLEELGYVTKD